MEDLLLGVDGGQTATRALVARIDGTILGRGRGGPVRHLFSGVGEDTRAALQEAISLAFAEAGIEPIEVAAAVCGLSGVRQDSPEAEKVAAIVGELVRPRRIEILPDFVTALAGASGGGAGVVVVAGGGSVAYGRAEDGREAQAGGWGYLLGDEGSAYDIGRRAVAAAIRASDGRGPATTLVETVKRIFDRTDLQEIKAIVYRPDFSRDRLAALAPLVAQAADAGDEMARRIMTAAGEELAKLALAVVHRLFDVGEAVSVYTAGGVFEAGAVLERPFGEALNKAWPTSRMCWPQHPPAVGALILARRMLLDARFQV
jgi:N-acetylglucosamine kinase-like BadF-type ATPase